MQIDDLAPLLSLAGIDIVNLQYGAAGRALAAAAPGIIDLGDAALPLDDYGAAVAATDLISPSTRWPPTLRARSGTLLG
jgi:hypothetical protein